MTPDEADWLLKWIYGMPDRLRRYREAGGTRSRWDCVACGWATEAHNQREARHKLLTCPVCCDHENLADSGFLMPPHDFK